MLKLILLGLIAWEMSGCETSRPSIYHVLRSQRMAMEIRQIRDHYGCDIPFFGSGLDCTAKGICCDQHDACIARYGCGGFLESKKTFKLRFFVPVHLFAVICTRNNIVLL